MNFFEYADEDYSSQRNHLQSQGQKPAIISVRRGSRRPSGFASYAQKLATQPASWYLGLGGTARFTDCWELIAKEGVGTTSALYQLQAEQTRQVDTGCLLQDDQRQWSASAFINRIEQFILVDDRQKTNGLVQNIDAQSSGAEVRLQLWL